MPTAAKVIKLHAVKGEDHEMKVVKVTPASAAKLLEFNTLNRPLTQPHVDRIARQIKDGKWIFNGDTIKVGTGNEVLDGQHRLWAIILADTAVPTIIVYGIDPAAFRTIDTLRKVRSGADIIGLHGCQHYRAATAAALAWLVRHQRGVIETFMTPENRIENGDIEDAFLAHPGMVQAIEHVRFLRGIATPSLIGFCYYLFSNRDEELANLLITTLESPAEAAVDDPFFVLRNWLVASKVSTKRRSPITSLAIIFKAWIAAKEGRRLKSLYWRNQGTNPETFPTID